MLPPRASTADEHELSPRASWQGVRARVDQRGSAKALGLVRTDGESTATVQRTSSAPPPPPPPPANDGDDDWRDGSDTLDRKSKPTDSDEEDGDGPATVLKGQKKLSPALLASSDDDDLNETKRADEPDDDDNLETPVGLKKVARPTPKPAGPSFDKAPAQLILDAPEPRERTAAMKTPMAMAVPASSTSNEEQPSHSPSGPPAPPSSPPPSGQTRVAPIAVAPKGAPTASAHQIVTPMPSLHGWAPPPNLQMPVPIGTIGSATSTKPLTLPAHRLALLVSMTLMVAALTFVFMRRHQQSEADAQAAQAQAMLAQQPPAPVEVLPQPQTPLVLPPAAPTWTGQAQPSPPPPVVATKGPSTTRKATGRATSRTTIPVHREQ